jgi:wyosine [tRNA(Phe)-imidazoG37] synthetase (radical SAM superfamily)
VLDLEDKTIETMKEAYRQIRIAEIYAQRVDWMMSGDDCEETLQRRLQEDLAKFEEEYASKKWYYPDTEEN